MSRLPIPGQDNGAWGALLNDYLSVSLNSDGTLRSGVVGANNIANGSIPVSALNVPVAPSLNEILSYDGVSLRWVAAGGTPDATSSIKGAIRLAGDLAGVGSTASAPVIADNAITSNKIANGAIVDADINASAAIAQSKVSGLTSSLSGLDTRLGSAEGSINGFNVLLGAPLPLSLMPPGTTITVDKNGSSWPARPTARTDIIVRWRGADPSPPIVSSGTGGMLDNVDERQIPAP